ncbi:hypothetical protein, partial [Vibrio cidicii]
MYIDLPKDRIGNIHDNQKYEREKERLRGDRCGYEIPKTGSVEDVTKRLIASQILSKQVFDDSVSTANEAVKKVDVN